MFGWFKAGEAKAFGAAMADYVIKQFPADNKTSLKKAEGKNEFITKKLALQIAEFKQRERLNIYKKAQLGNAFRWKLTEAGYDTAYVEALTNFVLMRL